MVRLYQGHRRVTGHGERASDLAILPLQGCHSGTCSIRQMVKGGRWGAGNFGKMGKCAGIELPELLVLFLFFRKSHGSEFCESSPDF